MAADVFDRFRDETGSFSEDLISDPRGLLSLYNVAHMAVPGEAILDEAIAFARRHLEAAIGKLGSPGPSQVRFLAPLRFRGPVSCGDYRPCTTSSSMSKRRRPTPHCSSSQSRKAGI